MGRYRFCWPEFTFDVVVASCFNDLVITVLDFCANWWPLSDVWTCEFEWASVWFGLSVAATGDKLLSDVTESSLCHLEFCVRAWLIAAQRSFLHDFDLKMGWGWIIRLLDIYIEVRFSAIWCLPDTDTYLRMDCNQSLNWVLPSGVIWKAARAANMMLAKSS